MGRRDVGDETGSIERDRECGLSSHPLAPGMAMFPRPPRPDDLFKFGHNEDSNVRATEAAMENVRSLVSEKDGGLQERSSPPPRECAGSQVPGASKKIRGVMGVV